MESEFDVASAAYENDRIVWRKLLQSRMATPFNRDRFWWCTEFNGSQTVSDQISDKSKLVIRLSQSPSLLISGSGSLAQLSRSLLPQKHIYLY